ARPTRIQAQCLILADDGLNACPPVAPSRRGQGDSELRTPGRSVWPPAAGSTGRSGVQPGGAPARAAVRADVLRRSESGPLMIREGRTPSPRDRHWAQCNLSNLAQGFENSASMRETR